MLRYLYAMTGRTDAELRALIPQQHNTPLTTGHILYKMYRDRDTNAPYPVFQTRHCTRSASDTIVNGVCPNCAAPDLGREHTGHHMYLYRNFFGKLARYMGSLANDRRPGEPLIVFLYIADLQLPAVRPLEWSFIRLLVGQMTCRVVACHPDSAMV